MRNLAPELQAHSSVPITLLVGPVSSGKTETILAYLQEDRTGRALVLVPSEAQQKYLTARLHKKSRLVVRNFAGLAQLILQLAKSKVLDLSKTLHTLLLENVVQELANAGKLPLFAKVATKPGFLERLDDLLIEARAAEIVPQTLAQAEITPYDAELSTIYVAYAAALETFNLADAARRLTLAKAALRNNPSLLCGFSTLVIDGFDEFTPLQLDFLTELTCQVAKTTITLTWTPDKRPAQRRFNRTYDQLFAKFQPKVVEISPFNPAAPILHYLQEQLFALEPQALPDTAGKIKLIEAADREREVRAALRHVHSLLKKGVKAEEIALFFRNSLRYEPLLHEIAAEYKLPITFYSGLPLIEAPPIAAFLLLLRLPLENYPRRLLSEVWRSFADGRLVLSAAHALDFGDFDLAASQLERVTRDSGGSVRFERMCKLLESLDPNTDILPGLGKTSPLLAPEAAALLALLKRFKEWLNPPSSATVADYVAWIQEKINFPAVGEARKIIADKAEMDSPWRSLQDLLYIYAQATTILKKPPVNYRAFLAELNTLLKDVRYGQSLPKPGFVAAMMAKAARGLHFDHVVLLGLVEGDFPPLPSNPPFYSRRERALLAQRGLHLPPPDPAEEQTLFLETVARARQSLALTRPYLDEKGNSLSPSPFMTALQALVQPLIPLRIKAGSVPTWEEAVSAQEKLVALISQNKDFPEIYKASSLSSLYQHVKRASGIEKRREETTPYTLFEGLITNSSLLEQLEQNSKDYHWSVTQFNDYITCPFRFLAAHIFKIEAQNEPEEGLDRAVRGRIYHGILAEAGQNWIKQGLTFTQENEQTIVESVNAAAAKVLVDAPQKYHFYPGPFWAWEQKEIQQRLEQALRIVIQKGKIWVEFRPLALEQRFAPLAIQTNSALGEVQVAGRIDRIDQAATGLLAVIDYKSSNAPQSLKRTLNGLDVQLPIYLLAAEKIFPGQAVSQAAFLHIGSGKFSAALTSQNREQALAAMHTGVTSVVQGVQTGYFPVKPREKCTPGCAFESICRLNPAKRDEFSESLESDETNEIAE